MDKLAIYIHIPFCDHKCIYCDFYSITNYKNKETYLKCLKKEVLHYANLYSNEYEVNSIYFGGGTPSFVSPEYISAILDQIKNSFQILNNVEITLETNPGTVDYEKLGKFLDIGINRLSIGIQSFDEDDLKFLTRIHDSETARDCVLAASKAGFENISIDLIFNLPGQTKEKWLKNLKQAIELPINHISAYSLILEKGTILNKMVLDGKIILQDEDYDAELYETTIDFLNSKGFLQYEVSNFAKPGYESSHNKAYWHYDDYLGFGTSSHSFIKNKRWWNYASLEFYNRAVNEKGHAVAGSEVLTPSMMLEEFVMLALRSDGIDIAALKNRFGKKWLDDNQPILDNLKSNGLLNIENGLIRLTKKGYLLCDEILLNFSY
ncbi:radical SAM family heme chaperone HemW [Melioribacter sp. OK-6-Me]|uniref:radical SAM family heme chaperone HemW n=1 Tax=unclassified Melioribacter TaxID=2627329 RepID=UPI003EDAB20A